MEACLVQKHRKQKTPPKGGVLQFLVVPLGLEPRLFCTKNRRVASYTIDHSRFGSTKVVLGALFENLFCEIFINFYHLSIFQKAMPPACLPR